MCRNSRVGSQLVKELVAKQLDREVWLLAPKYRAAFYERNGFEVVPPWQVPRCLIFPFPCLRSAQHTMN